MTESTVRPTPSYMGRVPTEPFIGDSLQPGGSISMAFSDGIVQVTLDQTGDWTITAGLSASSDRLVHLTKTLEDLGFFHAADQAGVIYHLWTTALGEESDNRVLAEKTLLKVLQSFQSRETPSYIS